MTTLQGKIKFTDSHQPGLYDGDYTVNVTQSIKSGNTDIELNESISSTFKFSVRGPRFTLDPQLIEGVFPPAGSLGDHSDVLPHILLNRSTLPWERSGAQAESAAEKLPWLALLLFEEDELSTSAEASDKAVTSTQSVSALLSEASTTIKWPGIHPENGQHEDDIVIVLDVPYLMLTAMMPSGDDLKYLAHVRQTEDAIGKAEEELAVIIGNRLPKPGSSHTVHLVSVEERYSQNKFNFQDATKDDKIRLISLKSWRFACTQEKNESFTGLARNLKPGLLKLPLLTDGSEEDKNYANEHLNQGSTPLPHAMRQGNKSISWYHGPFVPGFNASNDFTLPIRSADDLVYFNKTYGVFDVSYAAAWELGRLLVLQNNRIATSLFHWKRTEARKQKNKNNAAELELSHLPFDGPKASLGLPDVVVSWFEHMRLLDGVPFHYLVPHEKMLPEESIRFFQVDPLWLECLLDGAFSIGRVSSSDHKQDTDFKKDANNSVLPQRISGFLLRSDLASGWPGLQIEAYDENINTKAFIMEKTQIIKDLPLAFADELNEKGLSDKLLQIFNAYDVKLDRQQCTIENRVWLIEKDQYRFKLVKRENNAIDVCDAADDRYIFSIDESLETELNRNTITQELIEAFQKQKLDLPPKSSVSVMTWFLTDHQNQKHFLIEKKTGCLDIYRHYKLPLLRMARLSGNILLCLFEGVIQTIDLHLKPGTLHFGLNKIGDKFSKEIRSLSNRPLDNPIVTVTWRVVKINDVDISQEKRIIDISILAKDIRDLVYNKDVPISSAEFALEMIAGSEKIRICLSGK